ncbi:hypothetical protein BDN71DRAFT_1512886 [Pleurotus eryngii]|uniref:Uncharacterized protein n=1 Tax=Pleurotus eryngii TaxID=5323 RepID=A0A9P5ZJP5_PLEER|nr:hypothetical protein BDN71DRAFT_1512886 [Pleurotus eryngii]
METGDTSNPNQTTLCITHTQQHLAFMASTFTIASSAGNWITRQAPSVLYTFPSDLASQLRVEMPMEGVERLPSGLIEDVPKDAVALIAAPQGDAEMNDDPESDGTMPRKRLKAISGADTDCGCNTRRGGETTRTAGSRSASIQEAASEEEGGVTSERLVILEASQANLSVKFTSAQLLARAQDINLREELVERLWAQTQRNQLEMQALALQLDQERAGYLNQLANKEDEVQALRQDQVRLQQHLQSAELRAASVEPVVILAKECGRRNYEVEETCTDARTTNLEI